MKAILDFKIGMCFGVVFRVSMRIMVPVPMIVCIFFVLVMIGMIMIAMMFVFVVIRRSIVDEQR